MKTPRPSHEYLEAYEREVRRLKSSVERYDRNEDSENAIRDIANSVRQLVKTKGNTTSILDHVEKKEIKFLDTNPTWLPNGLLPQDGFLAKDMHGHYLPKLDKCPPQDIRWVEFIQWWHQVIFSNPEGLSITRSKLTLTLAEQDGGTHTDNSIDSDYFALTRQNAMGWKYGAGGFSLEFRSPLASAMRQIAHELLRSLDTGYRKVPENEPDFMTSGHQLVYGKHKEPPMYFIKSMSRDGMICIRDGVPVKSNDPCHCGSGKKLKRCHGHKAVR